MRAKFKSIIPSKFKLTAMKTAIKAVSGDVGGEIKKDFEKTTRTWEHNVNFRVESSGVFSMTVKIYTTDQIYFWVNDGTNYRFIAGPVMVTTGFKPKTRPGVIDSFSGSKGIPIYARNVEHPGSEARKFDEAIAKKWEPKLQVELQLALDAGAIASGHGFARR